MLTSLLHDARMWPASWRRTRVSYWLYGVKDHLPFIVMLGLPLLGVAGIVCFAYLHGRHAEPVPVEAQASEHGAIRARHRENDLECLAQNIYFEARGEPLDGQYAVAEVTLNRTRAPNFPHTVCAVVHEMRWDPTRHRHVADFSWTAMGALSTDDAPAWKQAMTVANAAYDDLRDPVVPGALFYHSTRVRPGWAKSRTAIAKIGNHVFYR